MIAVSPRLLARAICRRCRGCPPVDEMRKHPTDCEGVKKIIRESQNEINKQQRRCDHHPHGGGAGETAPRRTEGEERHPNAAAGGGTPRPEGGWEGRQHPRG